MTRYTIHSAYELRVNGLLGEDNDLTPLPKIVLTVYIMVKLITK